MGKNFSIEAPYPRDAGRELPLHWEEGPTIAGGLFLVAFGVVFGLFPIMALTGWPAGQPWCQPWMLLIFAPPAYAISLGTIAVGLDFLVHRMKIQVDADTVWVSRRSLRGLEHWVEPRKSYLGVLRREDFFGGDTDHTKHKAILKHRHDEDRNVELYNHYTPEGYREAVDCFARLLDLPLLLEKPDGSFREVAVDDLEKTDAELISEGKLEARFDAAALPPGRRLEFWRESDKYLFRTRPPRFEVAFGLVFGSIGVGVAIYTALQGGEMIGVLAGLLFGLLFAVPGYAVAAHAAFSREVVSVDSDEVRTSKLFFDLERRREALPIDDIETVEIAKTERGDPCVRLWGDGRQLECGKSLGKEQLGYLRRCILARLDA